MADTLLASARENLAEWEAVARDLEAALARLRKMRREDRPNTARPPGGSGG